MNQTRVTAFLFAATFMACSGCERWNYSGDRFKSPTDLSEPPDKVSARLKAEGINIADELEEMEQRRQSYVEQLTRIEKIYLENGDTVRANWARRQRQNTEKQAYPYGSSRPPERTVEVRPEQPIPEADRMYAEAESLIKSFRGVPLLGVLDTNKQKAGKAVGILRDLIRRYPKSDKVDDAAYWIGECYKEYLRDDDPDNALALRYYQWAIELDPRTPHPARFQTAVVYDFRLRNHTKALETYRAVLEENEDYHPSNLRFAADRIKQLTDDLSSPERPREEREPSGEPSMIAAQDERPKDGPAEPTVEEQPQVP